MMRGAVAQLRYRMGGADHKQMERLKAEVSQACRGWPADRVAEIVSRYLKDLIVPYVYAEARAQRLGHRPAPAGGRRAPAGGQPGPRTPPRRRGPRLARAVVQRRVSLPAGMESR